MKRLSFFVLFCLITACAFGQYSYNMGSQTAVTGCNIYIYDDGGPNGPYSANTEQVMTIYSGDANNRCVMVDVTSLSVDEGDTLFIYDGPDTSSPLLHWLNDGNHDSEFGVFRYAATIQNPTGAVTLRFKSNATQMSEGFQIHATCMAPCQRVEVFLDTLQSSHIPQRDATDHYYYINLCPGEQVHLAAYCTYPDNDYSYHQEDATTTFQWDFDTESTEIVGGTEVDHTFTTGRGYDVALSAYDSSNCPSLTPVTFRIRTSQNPFIGVSPLQPICSSETVDVSVGYDSLSVVQLTPINSAQLASLQVTDTVFLPDGSYCDPYGYYYRSYVNFTNFAPGATITSANDILYVRIKMEHSAIEDIRISLVCPNGNTCKIVPDYQNDGWGGVSHPYFRTNLGLANRSLDTYNCSQEANPMGVPWNYIWSNNTTLGYQYANTTYGYCIEPGNIHSTYNPNWDSGSYSYCIDSSNVANMTQIYHPYQSFSNMVNCPLNGNWYIQVQDLWSNDNGYIVEWEMALDESLLPQDWAYDVAVDTVFLVGPGSTGLHIAPDTTGLLSYNAILVDEFGCQYDTIFPLEVVHTPSPSIGDDVSVCDGTNVALSTNCEAPAPSAILWNTGATTDSISTTTSGTYSVTVSCMNSNGTFSCTGADTVLVVVNPNPVPAFTLSDTAACGSLAFICNDLSSPADLTYSWQLTDTGGTVVGESATASPSFELNTPGDYSIALQVATSAGCVDSTNRDNCVHVYPQPAPELGDDVSVCDGTAVQLTPYSSQPEAYVSQEWSTGSTEEQITVTTSGIYVVTVTYANEGTDITCSGSDSVRVQVNPNPVPAFTLSDSTACGHLTFSCSNHTTPSSGITYYWRLTDEWGAVIETTSQPSPHFEVNAPGDYSISLLAITDEGCADSIFRQNCVHVYAQPTADFAADPKQSFYSESQGVVSFTNLSQVGQSDNNAYVVVWNFGDGSGESSDFSPTHTYGDWGEFIVTMDITTGHGCSASASDTVFLEPDLDFPNVITPNGDNVNDVFAIVNLNTNFDPSNPKGTNSNELFIYNRWGKRVYHAENYDTYVRDGELHIGERSFDANELSDGVYYYTFLYRGRLRELEHHGSLTVIR